jgi:hypothetical protein
MNNIYIGLEHASCFNITVFKVPRPDDKNPKNTLLTICLYLNLDRINNHAQFICLTIILYAP